MILPFQNLGEDSEVEFRAWGTLRQMARAVR